MTLREVLVWPDPRLKEVCTPVVALDEHTVALAEDLLETMYQSQGRGLAAPQVGELVRMFVMDTGWKEGRADPQVCINPMFQEIGEDRTEAEEACLSIPGVTALINRPAQVQMVWTSVTGARVVQSFTGFDAVCVQHEMDHLDGVVTLDHLSAETRAKAEVTYLEAMK